MAKADKEHAALLRAADALASKTLALQESYFGTFLDDAVKAAVKYKRLREKEGTSG